MTADFIPFKPGHMDLLEAKKVFMGDATLIERCELSKANGGIVYSLIVGYRVIAVMGMDLKWPGVAEVWSVTSELVRKYPVEFHSNGKKMMELYAKEFKLWRLQATVLHDFVDGKSWVKALGFEQEALLKKYGPEGKDYLMFARFL